MSGDMPLFDVVNGVRRRDAAIDQGERNAMERWREAALHAVRACAHRYDLFTTDQVEETLQRLNAPRTHDMRALGSVMRRAAAMDLIEPTDSIRQSALPQNHRRPKRVWRSLLR